MFPCRDTATFKEEDQISPVSLKIYIFPFILGKRADGALRSERRWMDELVMWQRASLRKGEGLGSIVLLLYGIPFKHQPRIIDPLSDLTRKIPPTPAKRIDTADLHRVPRAGARKLWVLFWSGRHRSEWRDGEIGPNLLRLCMSCRYP